MHYDWMRAKIRYYELESQSSCIYVLLKTAIIDNKSCYCVVNNKTTTHGVVPSYFKIHTASVIFCNLFIFYIFIDIYFCFIYYLK